MLERSRGWGDQQQGEAMDTSSDQQSEVPKAVAKRLKALGKFAAGTLPASGPDVVRQIQVALVQCLADLEPTHFVQHAPVLAAVCNQLTPGNFEPLVRYVQRTFKPGVLTHRPSHALLELL